MEEGSASDAEPQAVFAPVAEFRQILIWPLALDPAEGDAAAHWRREGDRIAGPAEPEWREVDDLLAHVPSELGEPSDLPAEERQERYAEFVYFNDIAQGFLYPRDGRDRLFRLFRRDDVRAMRIETGGKNARVYTLQVDRLNLYLTRGGVALLVTEIGVEPSLAFDLSDAMRLQDDVRRTYTPYFSWSADDRAYDPRLTPERVTLIGEHGNICVSHAQNLSAVNAQIREHRAPPVFDHWKTLLPLSLGRGPAAAGRPVWRPLADERMHILSFIRLGQGTRLDDVPRADYTRLCFADPADDSPNAYFYDEKSLTTFEADHCYDRFYAAGTRQMFSGFSYVVVCKDDGFARNVLRNHFRHMYFQMALIAHLERATCFALSSRLAAATRGGVAGPAFEATLLNIHEQFLEYIHQFRFRTVSTQMQAVDLFELFRSHLRLDALSAELKDEIKASTDYLFAKLANARADAANRLNVIAIGAVTVGLVFAFLGMNVMWDGGTVEALLTRDWPAFRSGLALGARALGASMIAGVALVWVGAEFLFREVASEDTAKRSMRAVLGSLLAAGVATLLAGVLTAP